MELEEHARLLGRLLGNLQSLEFLLRAFLYEQADAPHDPMPPGVSLFSMQVGESVNINAMTDYDSLGQHIDRYNQRVARMSPELAVDRTLVVELRDALAHGRVSARDPAEHLLLMKFDRPANGRTRVVYRQEVTPSWLKNQATRVLSELQKIARAPGSPVVNDP